MPSLLQISWIFGHTSTWRKLCTKIPKMRNQKICKPRNLTFFEETYSQWNWFWPIFVFCNNSSISQPNLMFSSAFFWHWSVDSDTHLNFENTCRHSDLRNILRRQVSQNNLKLFLIGPLSDDWNFGWEIPELLQKTKMGQNQFHWL